MGNSKSKTHNKVTSKSIDKRKGSNFDKVFKISAVLLIALSVVLVFFGMPLFIDGLLYKDVVDGWDSLSKTIEYLIGMAAILAAAPMFFSSICAYRYFHGKSGGKLTACFIWPITACAVYLALAIFIWIGMAMNSSVMAIILMMMAPYMLFIYGCYRESKRREAISR